MSDICLSKKKKYFFNTLSNHVDTFIQIISCYNNKSMKQVFQHVEHRHHALHISFTKADIAFKLKTIQALEFIQCL